MRFMRIGVVSSLTIATFSAVGGEAPMARAVGPVSPVDVSFAPQPENPGSLRIPVFSAGDLTFTRYLADGSVDPTFGEAGVSRVPGASPGASRGSGPLTAVDRQDRVVVAPYGRVLRLLASGGLDPTFAMISASDGHPFYRIDGITNRFR